MSYILEALKKSERERNKDGVPNLHTNHAPSSVRVRQRRAPVLKWVAVGVVLFAGAAVGVFVRQQRQLEVAVTEVVSPVAIDPIPVSTPAPVTSVPAPTPVPKVVPADVVRESVPLVKKDISQPEPETVAVAAEVDKSKSTVVQREKEAQKPVAAVPPPSALPVNTDYPLLEELSLSIRNRIPDLHFAGHVYSESGSGRMIIINNRIVREGDIVGDSLALQKITREGVVMQFEDSVFKVKLF